MKNLFDKDRMIKWSWISGYRGIILWQRSFNTGECLKHWGYESEREPEN
jgi:hypothetical protein